MPPPAGARDRLFPYLPGIVLADMESPVKILTSLVLQQYDSLNIVERAAVVDIGLHVTVRVGLDARLSVTRVRGAPTISE